MGRTAAPAIKDPFEIIIEKARGYVYRNKYPRVIVFTKYVMEFDTLIQTFGGGRYSHGTGYVWVLSKRADILQFLEQIKPYLPSKYGFEDVLNGYFGNSR